MMATRGGRRPTRGAFDGGRLGDIRGFAFDLDGTVWSGETLLPGAAEFVTALREARRDLVFVSNNSRQLATELSLRLARLGIPAEPREVLSAVELIGEAIARQLGPVAVLALGSPEMCGVLRSSGHEVVELDDWRRARAVAVGVDRRFDYDRLRAAASAVCAGALLFAVNLDARFPDGPGRLEPGCGALAEAIAVAGGRRPIAVGKPGRPLFQMALERLGCAPGEALMIGDSAEADIAGAAALGMRTAWIEDPSESGASIRADWSIKNLAELHALWAAPGRSP